MEFLELKNISERYLDLLNPTTTEKILAAGRVAGMKPGSRVVDFGTGHAEVLVLWARAFGISGLGIDIRPAACDRARQRVAAQSLSDRIEIACGNAAEYPVAAQGYDVASCIGATFIWKDGFREAVRAMRGAIKPGGRLVVGEAYWLHAAMPPAFAQSQLFMKTEPELLTMARQEGLDLVYVLHSSHDDWDHYEAENWRGLSDWLDENPDHPEREDVLRHLRASQDEYFQYGREYLGWALYVLRPGA